jgi:radical SAM superfamily enzyme YgiQ (UPF0313 family)
MYDIHAIYFPPDELSSVFLPVTTGCLYNKCAFCSMYKGEKNSEISLQDIEKELLNGPLYTEKVFLTGADPMSVGYKKIKQILKLIKKYLPYCACVASYASIRSISKYTLEELSILHEEGLRLLYIGFESGRDDVLKLMKKGHTVEEAITQAKKLNKAKLQFNTIIIYGIAGEGESINNAVATAKMINKFMTKRIITMNLTVFIPTKGKERLIEVKTLLENLEPKQPTIFDTTHPTNIIKSEGTLPYDREKLINKVTRAISKKAISF